MFLKVIVFQNKICHAMMFLKVVFFKIEFITGKQCNVFIFPKNEKPGVFALRGQYPKHYVFFVAVIVFSTSMIILIVPVDAHVCMLL